MKLLLPYECHIRHDTVTDCLSKVDSSVFRDIPLTKKLEVYKDDECIDTIIPERKMNGEAKSGQNSRRLNSRTSDSSTGEPNSQERDELVQDHVDMEEQPPDVSEEPETASYPQDVSSDEPLPEISAQETESLLAMPASPYLQPPVTTGVPSTPLSDPTTPPSSFPPPYPPTASQEWGPPSGQDMFPNSGYPSSYPMDASSYRPPHPHLPPGYNPYNPLSQPEIGMDYHLDMHSPMMRSPYDSNPYHMGISAAIHGLPGSRHNPYLYRAQMMSRGDPFNIRGNDVIYSGTPGMNADWGWQQGSQFPSMMHHHSVQSPSRTNPALQQSQRHPMLQHSSHAAQHHSSANQHPGIAGDATKQPWQDSAKGSLSRSLDRTNSQTRSTRGEYKSGSSKSEHTQDFDSLKRPLPDWSGCVEGTKPLLAKRKHLLSVDCGKYFKY